MTATLTTTLGDTHYAADICRARGWTAGTLLVGDEGYGPEVIRITAVGEQIVLARTVSRNGKGVKSNEDSWCFACRDWKEL